MSLSQHSAWPKNPQLKNRIASWVPYAFLVVATLGIVQKCLAGNTIHVSTTSPGVTGQCSLQEAIYSAELGASIAVNKTDSDTTYTTTCEPGTGNGDTII